MSSALSVSRSALVLVALCASQALDTVPAAGQTPATPRVQIQGVVVDAITLDPVDSATVTLVGSDVSVTTPQWGTFEIDVPPGPVALHVTAPGRASVIVDTEVLVDRPSFVRVPLPTFALTLSELLVEAEPNDAALAGPARTAADLVAREVPRLLVTSGQVGQSDFAINLRSATSFGGPQAPLVVIDGIVLSRGPAAFEALERIPAADVAEIEVLRGASAAFLYPMAANGVILVTTKRGQAR
ncbi:MAG: TonB-dependent receptor plug domain-containing protein [Gemmatimonadales bacterium]